MARNKSFDVRARLDEFPLLAGLTREAMDTVAKACRPRLMKADQIIIAAGDPATQAYFLVRGVVRISMSSRSGKEKTVRLLQSPAIFGEMEVLTGTEHIETVDVASASAELVLMGADEFTALLDRSLVVTRRLLTDVCARWRSTALSESFSTMASVEARLAALFLDYASVFGLSVAGGVQLVTPGLSQRSLARGVGATRKSVQRTLEQWADAGLVEKRGRYFVLRALEPLAAIAGVDAPKIAHRLSNPAVAASRAAWR